MADDDNNEEFDDNEDKQGHIMANAVTVNENTNEHIENSIEDID